MGELIVSLRDLVVGLARNLVGFVPLGLIGLADALGADVPGELYWGFVGVGAVWAVWLTFHQLRLDKVSLGRQLDGSTYFGTLTFRGPGFYVSGTTLRPYLDLYNGHGTALNVWIDYLRVNVGGAGVEAKDIEGPILIPPHDGMQIKGGAGFEVPLDADLPGRMEYRLRYGLPVGDSRIRAARACRFSVTATTEEVVWSDWTDERLATQELIDG